MKLIVAFVKPFKVPELVDAFHQEPGNPGMTVLDAKGFGRQVEPTAGARSGATTDFFEHALVLVAVPHDQVESLVGLISQVAHTGRPGDGKVLVLPLEAALAISSGERGEAALG
ncbi:MAG TPA: P-II family nitrogen regulator [Actinomycetota bacterium]|nr:P-II family nitrogen regulator [Actinomycetota bacterium]